MLSAGGVAWDVVRRPLRHVYLKLLDLNRAPYVLYGVKYIDPVSLAPLLGQSTSSHAPDPSRQRGTRNGADATYQNPAYTRDASFSGQDSSAPVTRGVVTESQGGDRGQEQGRVDLGKRGQERDGASTSSC